ncbi:MAG TPA: hypothetical protein VIV12_10200 [Streptosporangiaceae bacterium]
MKTNSRRSLFITSWTLAADSSPRYGIPPRQLSEDELISFRVGEQTIIAPPASAS